MKCLAAFATPVQVATWTALILLGACGLSAYAAAAPESSSPPAPAIAGAMAWRNVGPWIGGRVVTVTGVPGQRNLFYMGAVDGGVWRSTDYGSKWVNISDGTLPGSSNSIGALAVAPSNPQVIYAGTGESDIRGDLITGDGVFRSDDAGKSWHAAGLEQTHTVSAVVVDPKNPDVVYAASMGHVFKSNPERGVFKSVDGGKSWKKVLYTDGRTGAIALVMDPQDANVLYAAMWQANRTPWKLDDGGPGSGLYKSTDAGASWTEISRHSGFPHGVLGRIGVSVVASQPNVVYSIVQAKGGGVFRSSDGGASWARVNSNWSLRQRAFYYMSIYADPSDADTVYVPEVDALWVSHDGGKQFAKLNTPHGDNHIVWINPQDPKLLLEGNDGGATVSLDGGKTWSSEQNQPTGQFYHVALDGQFPFHIYGAQQDEGSFEGPSATDGGMIPLGDWHSVAYGESTFIAPMPGDSNVTFGSGYYSILLRYDMATGQSREVSPWPDYQEGAASNELKYRFAWTHPILFSAANPNELLLASQYVLTSNDSGENWTRISPDLTRNDPATEKPSGGPVDLDQSGAEIFPDISALAASPLDGKLIWAGSADGLVHVTTDGGTHWHEVTPKGLPQWAEISSIEPSHVAKGTAWLAASRYMWDDFHPYVFETIDYGAHWTARTNGLPDDQYVFVVRQDPDVPGLLFLGTANTVYASFDGGTQWQPLSLNLPKVQVRDLAIDALQGELVAATHGRSFWVLDNLALLEQRAGHAAVSLADAQVYAPETSWLSHAYGQSPYAKFVPAVGPNPPFGASVFFHIPASYDGKTPVRLAFMDADGKLVRRFSLHLQAAAPQLSAVVRDNRTPQQVDQAALEKLTTIKTGMNRFQWDLRYPDATEVTGFQAPDAAGGLPDTVQGPTVLPGRYTVVLDYNGHQTQKTFEVKLDPRLHPAADALQQRLALLQRIHGALDALDSSLNQAIAMRAKLGAAIAHHQLDKARVQAALSALDQTIGSLVQFDIKASEGSLLHETKLRSHLAYLAADIDLAYDKPTPAEYQVFDQLNQEAQSGERQLAAAMARGKGLL